MFKAFETNEECFKCFLYFYITLKQSYCRIVLSDSFPEVINDRVAFRQYHPRNEETELNFQGIPILKGIL